MSINVASKLTGVYSLGIYHDIFKDSMDWNKKLSDYILKEQWNELSNHSSKMRGLNGIIIEQIHGESIQLKDVRKILKETNFEDIFSKLKIQLQDSTFREEVNKILLEQNKSPELIDKFLQINFTNSNFNMDLDDTTSTVMEIVIGAGGSAFVAGFHSIYNQYYSEYQTVCTSIISEELEEIKKIIKLEYEMIMSDFYKIYASLVQGSAHGIIDTCQKILHSQESRLVWLASICGTLSLCTMNYSKDKDNKSAKMFGPVDLLAGQTTRTWFLLCLVCLYVTRLSLLPEDDPQLKKEI